MPCHHDNVCAQVRELWAAFVGQHGEKLTRLHAILLYHNLDHSHVLGWAPHRKRRPPCYNDFVKARSLEDRGSVHSLCT